MSSSNLRNWLRLIESEPDDPAAQFLAMWHTPDPRVTVHLKKMNPYQIELSSIEVPAELRRQRMGTATVNALTELADKLGVSIILYPEPSAAERLLPYYERFGFISMDGGNSMEYEPVD